MVSLEVDLIIVMYVDCLIGQVCQTHVVTVCNHRQVVRYDAAIPMGSCKVSSDLGLPGLPLGPLRLVLRLPGLPRGPLLLPLCLPGLPVGPLLRPDSPDIGWGAGAQEGQVAAILGRVALLAAPGAARVWQPCTRMDCYSPVSDSSANPSSVHGLIAG